MTEPVLQICGLSKRFGGLIAVDDVSLGVCAGQLHAVIGPNGAGKTTLINIVSGDLSADNGSILFRGEDIVQLAPERRSRLGIGRSYQKVNIFPAFSAFENCRLAAQSRDPRQIVVRSCGSKLSHPILQSCADGLIVQLSVRGSGSPIGTCA